MIRENFEALTQNEGGGSSSPWACWSSINGTTGSTWQCGSPCTKEVGLPYAGEGVCK